MYIIYTDYIYTRLRLYTNYSIINITCYAPLH